MEKKNQNPRLKINLKNNVILYRDNNYTLEVSLTFGTIEANLSRKCIYREEDILNVSCHKHALSVLKYYIILKDCF